MATAPRARPLYGRSGTQQTRWGHPHDLRHRYASVQIGRDVPVTQVAAQLGDSKKSMTVDVYSQVMVND